MDEKESSLEAMNVAQMENLGYAVLPKSHQDSPGFSGIMVTIRQVPTNSHFDPESIDLWIRDRNGLTGQLKISLESYCAESDQVSPGAVRLTDRYDKRVDFFTFGGHLETVTRPGERRIILRSPAPILEIFNDLSSFSDQLAFEAEGLLARMHALWTMDDEGFARRLGQAEPLEFYLTSLNEIMGRYEHHRDLRSSWPGFYSKLVAEKDWLIQQGRWPASVTSPEDLLAPPKSQPDLIIGGVP